MRIEVEDSSKFNLRLEEIEEAQGGLISPTSTGIKKQPMSKLIRSSK
jgi:hypothetical protein